MDTEGRLNEAAMWVGHYFMYIFAAGATLLAAEDFTDRTPAGTALSYIGDVVWPVVILAVLLNFMVHGHRLCERCVTASPVLNPQASVNRWHWALRFTHSPKLLYPAMAVMLIGALFGGLLWRFLPYPWNIAQDIARLVVLAVLMVAAFKHDRLQPWCPYCRWGNGGDKETVPDPDPAVSL